MTERLWDERLDPLGVRVIDADTTEPHWWLKAAWLTVNGSWDDVPDWARKWQLDTLGGAQHAFGRCLDKDGNPLMGAGFMLEWPGMADEDKKWRLPQPDGWANDELWAGYDWTHPGGGGPYSWRKAGNADVLRGLGLPYPPAPWDLDGLHAQGGLHCSFFGVWQEREAIVEPEPPQQEKCWEYLWQFFRCILGRL